MFAAIAAFFAKASALTTALIIGGGVIVGGGAATGIYFAVNQPQTEASSAEASAAAEDTTGIGSACRDFIVLSAQEIQAPSESFQAEYAAAAAKTTDSLLKKALTDIGENRNVPGASESKYLNAVEAISGYCIKVGAFTGEQLNSALQGVVENLDSQSSGESKSEVSVPRSVDISTLNGSTITVTVEQNVVLIKTSDPLAWSGTVANPDVAYFTPAGTYQDENNQTAIFDMCFSGNGSGATQATLTNSSTGEVISFTIISK